MKLPKPFTPVLLFYLTPLFAQAQSLQNLTVEIAGEEIIITYDLVGSASESAFTLYIYSSHNSFNTPLQLLSGDIGIDIKAGVNKRVIWKAKNELGNYKGKLALELRGQVYIPFISFESTFKAKNFKRGKVYPIQWSGGNSVDNLRFELYQGDNRLQTLGTSFNSGNYPWNVSTKLKPGKDFKLKVSDANNADEAVFSDGFTISRKLPLLLKLAPIVAAIAATAIVVTVEEPKIIPDPPLPSN